ncbi:MAG: peptide chain release factor N(5)-glutamine methyltransferase [Phycisphaerales bacterium]|nr:MAG: peptide chain release factor N(5)-glutamine methyltransferase [Phycisphaerales bacterium]
MGQHPDTNETEWTIGRLLSWTSDYFAQRDIEDARLSAEVLLSHAAECRRIDLYARFDVPLEAGRLGRFREWVKRAADHEPIAYLVGEKEFFSLPFQVNPDVLIPRPETETVVEALLEHCRHSDLMVPRLLDVGTGSGCIAVSALVQLPNASAVATDCSAAALEVARTNALRHGVLDRLSLVEADRLALPAGVVPAGGFDVLASNPPYVARDAMDGLDAVVRDFEPRGALTDDGDGLSFYRSMAAEAAKLLADDGVVIVEVGDGLTGEVIEAMVSTGTFVHKETLKDRVVGDERVAVFALR